MSRQVIEDTIHQHLRHHLPRLRLGKKSLFWGFSHSHVSTPHFTTLRKFKNQKTWWVCRAKSCLEGWVREFLRKEGRMCQYLETPPPLPTWESNQGLLYRQYNQCFHIQLLPKIKRRSIEHRFFDTRIFVILRATRP